MANKKKKSKSVQKSAAMTAVAEKKRPLSKQQQRREQQQREARMKQVRIVGLLFLGIVVLAGLFFWRNAGVVPAEELVALVGPNIDGSANAPVQVIEYGDFGCPSCRAWHNAGIKDELKAQYGDQISFEFRHFPVITAQSPKAAEAAQCAAEQGEFWAFHDFVYEQLDASQIGLNRLKSVAATLELDTEAFNTCVDNGRFADYVDFDQQRALADGARGTPTFLINGMPAFPSFEAMAAQIDAVLEN